MNQGDPNSNPVIFHTPGCGKCLAAREFFRAAGLEPEMVNVAGDFANLRRMRALAKSRTVPVIQFAGEVRVGFDPAEWREKLERKS